MSAARPFATPSMRRAMESSSSTTARYTVSRQSTESQTCCGLKSSDSFMWVSYCLHAASQSSMRSAYLCSICADSTRLSMSTSTGRAPSRPALTASAAAEAARFADWRPSLAATLAGPNSHASRDTTAVNRNKSACR
eukprot:Amastigsp_a174631_13.p3 type:complete len:137 gc:universal Amastigsp_a174631_13:576-986(+)